MLIPYVVLIATQHVSESGLYSFIRSFAGISHRQRTAGAGHTLTPDRTISFTGCSFTFTWLAFMTDDAQVIAIETPFSCSIAGPLMAEDNH